MAGEGAASALEQSREGANESFGTDEVGSPTHGCKQPTWIAIRLVDMAGKPIPRAAYSIKLANGSVKTGTLGGDGTARVDGIEPGTCQVSFPELDQDAWEADPEAEPPA